MLDTDILQVTGRGRNVNFAIDDSLPLDAVVQGLRRSLAQNQHLYSRGTVTIEVGKRMLAREELTEIKRVLESESGLTISQFWCSPAVLEGVPPEKAGLGLRVTQPTTPAAAEPSPRDLKVGSAAPMTASEPDEKESHDDTVTAEGAPVTWLEPDFPIRPQVPSLPPAIADQHRQVENAQTAVLPSESQNRLDDKGSTLPGTAPASADDEPQEAQPVSEDSDSASTEPAPSQQNFQELEPAYGPARTIIDLKQEVVGLYRRNEALLVKTTCRSGEVIRYPGDIVVLADVNPGAEIIADGDILVFGTLRGLAHAGAGGDIQATVIALKLEAPRVQIGPHTGMAPKTKQRARSQQTSPMIAYVRRQHIFVAPFAGRFARYSGGMLYDG